MGLDVKPTERLKCPSLHALGLTHHTRMKAARTGLALSPELFLELPHLPLSTTIGYSSPGFELHKLRYMGSLALDPAKPVPTEPAVVGSAADAASFA